MVFGLVFTVSFYLLFKDSMAFIGNSGSGNNGMCISKMEDYDSKNRKKGSGGADCPKTSPNSALEHSLGDEQGREREAARSAYEVEVEKQPKHQMVRNLLNC